MSVSYEPRFTHVHKSLLEIKTIGGVEDKLWVLNACTAVAVVMGFGFFFYIPICIVLHIVLKHLTKRDPFSRRIYIVYKRQCDVYDPWPHAVQVCGHRPEGFGRGMLR